MHFQHHIYELIDPRTNSSRYVGVTCNPKARYQHHLLCYDGVVQKKYWIKELASVGLKPIMHIIESTHDRDIALEQEIYWITALLDQGAELLNIQHGVIASSRYSTASRTPVFEILNHYPNIKTRGKVEEGLEALEEVSVDLGDKDSYTIQELLEGLPFATAQMSQALQIPEYAIDNLINGNPIGADRVRLISLFLSWMYQRNLTIANITGIKVKETNRLVVQRLRHPIFS